MIVDFKMNTEIVNYFNYTARKADEVIIRFNKIFMTKKFSSQWCVHTVRYRD